MLIVKQATYLAHLHVLDLKGLYVQVIQPQQCNRICYFKACQDMETHCHSHSCSFAPV